MSTTTSNSLFLLGVVGIIGGLLVSMLALLELYLKLRSDNKDHYYDPRWQVSPFTHFALLFGKSKDYQEKAADGTIWLCRDVRIRQAGFWTRLQKVS